MEGAGSVVAGGSAVEGAPTGKGVACRTPLESGCPGGQAGKGAVGAEGVGRTDVSGRA